MSILQIPLKSSLQSYEISVVLELVTYILSFSFNRRSNIWSMDILNQDNENILMSLPMLTNTDIEGQYVSESLPPGIFLIFDTEGTDENPCQGDFGSRFLLLYDESIA